jgi:phenylpropionate dioxygenase-like ring-hydroxylating dioxygenase large terminal subunit
MTIEIVNHTGETVVISNFTKSRYVDPQYMEEEWRQVWRNNWLMAGLESDVTRPGDFFVFDLGREQILVTRTSTGQVQGFFNVCQHRGNLLVSEERGHAVNFRCAYHAWTYDIDGALSIIPYEERFLDGIPCDEKALPKVHTECWNGFVFIHLGDDPISLTEFLGPVADILAPYRFDRMTVVQDQTVYLDCNWKAVVDNFSELYHVDFLHPQHKRMVDCCNDTVHLFAHGHTGLAVPGATVNPRFPIPELPTDIQSFQLTSVGLNPEDFRGRVLDVRKAIQEQKRKVGRQRGMDYSAFDAEQLSDVWQYNLFPNAIFSFTPEHCWVLRPRPHATDPSRCEFDKISLVMFADPDLAETDDAILSAGRDARNTSAFLPEDYVRPARDVFHYDAVIAREKSMTDTIDQDVELLAGVQRGMMSSGFGEVFLNEDEMRIQHFHNHMDSLISGGLFIR